MYADIVVRFFVLVHNAEVAVYAVVIFASLWFSSSQLVVLHFFAYFQFSLFAWISKLLTNCVYICYL